MALDGARNQCQCMKQQLATHQGKNGAGKCYLWPHNAAPVPGYRMSRRILKLSWDLVCRASENVSKRPKLLNM